MVTALMSHGGVLHPGVAENTLLQGWEARALDWLLPPLHGLRQLTASLGSSVSLSAKWTWLPLCSSQTCAEEQVADCESTQPPLHYCTDESGFLR